MKTTISTFLAFLCLGNATSKQKDVSAHNGSSIIQNSNTLQAKKVLNLLTYTPDAEEHFKNFVFLEFPGHIFAKGDTRYFDRMKQKCQARSNTSTYQEVEKLLKETPACLIKSASGMSYSFKMKSDLCNRFHNGLHRCIVELQAEVELCVDESMKTVLGYNVDVFDSMFNYACKNNAEFALPLAQEMLKNDSCLHKVQTISIKCSKEPNSSFDFGSSANVSKSELCRLTAIWIDCVLENAKDECPEETYDVVAGLTLSAYTPCASESLHVYNFMLVLFACITIMY